MTTMPPARGRPRSPAPVHLVAMRELTAAMRQIRIAATGDSTDSSVVLLNRTIAELYPEPVTGGAPFNPPAPRPINAGYLRKLERGHHARLPAARWLERSGLAHSNRAYASNVPAWLVRAYDVAFGADGYLVDTYRWARQMQTDSEHDPPRATRHLPWQVPDGGEFAFLTSGFAGAPDHVKEVLRRQADVMCGRRHRPVAAGTRAPSAADSSSNRGDTEDELPEGTLAGPGEFRLGGWALDNTGSVPWIDRWLYRVGDGEAGIHAPAFVPVPDTEPGGRADIWVPLRAPMVPGTYRICLKMGWSDGVYCFPNTLLGLIVTLILPAADIIGWRQRWDGS